MVEHTFRDQKVAGSYPRRAIPKASKMVPMSCLVLCILQQTMAFISHLLQIPKKGQIIVSAFTVWKTGRDFFSGVSGA